MAFSSLLGMKRGARRDGIFTGAFVFGLRTTRARRREIPKVPKPAIFTRTPFLSARITRAVNASSARSESALVRPDSRAIRVTRSALFTAGAARRAS